MKELTRAEEELMLILWDMKKGFVKQILDRYPDPKPAYNTVSTIVRILQKKKVVGYKGHGRSHEYFPKISKEDYADFMIEKLAENYFDGSFKRLVEFYTERNDTEISLKKTQKRPGKKKKKTSEVSEKKAKSTAKKKQGQKKDKNRGDSSQLTIDMF